MKITETLSYWNDFYKDNKRNILPSQFAVFSMSEFSPTCVVDIGCGDGRDTIFFTEYCALTIGVDASSSALSVCEASGIRKGVNGLELIESDVSDELLSSKILELIPTRCERLLVYSRFFVHAVNKADEESLFRLVQSLLLRHRGYFVCEFRTTKDEFLPKSTANHYRRFVDPIEFMSEAKNFGLECEYFVEGKGMAKFGQDDAHVARLVLSMSDDEA
jgi:SAM-dependent methyltransferase